MNKSRFEKELNKNIEFVELNKLGVHWVKIPLQYYLCNTVDIKDILGNV